MEASRSSLLTSLVPGLAAPLKVDAKQSFAVEGEGYSRFYIEPVRYDSQDTELPGHTSFRCGVFFLSPEARPTFVPTIGYDRTEAVQCGSLEGVGFMASSGERTPPRVLLFYAVSSPNFESKEPVVLDWSSAGRRYVANESLSRRLEGDRKATGILGMKRQLLTYR